MDTGYVKAPHDIVRDPSLSATAKVAWLLIAGMPDGRHPTRGQWMAMLPCSDKRTWWRAVNELEQAGLIKVARQGSKKVYTAVTCGTKQQPIVAGDAAAQAKEQKKSNTEMRTRLREEVMVDMMVETGCRSCGITQEQYNRLADEIFSDWEFSDFPDYEWTKHHFLSVLRIKADKLKRNGVHQPRKTTVTGPVSGATQGANPLAGFPTYTKTGS